MVFPQDKAGILTAQAKAVREGYLRINLTRQTRNIIKVTFGIGRFQVDRRVDDSILKRLYRSNCLQRT